MTTRHQNTDVAVVAKLISRVVKMYISLLDQQQIKTEFDADECTYFAFIFLF